MLFLLVSKVSLEVRKHPLLSVSRAWDWVTL